MNTWIPLSNRDSSINAQLIIFFQPPSHLLLGQNSQLYPARAGYSLKPEIVGACVFLIYTIVAVQIVWHV